MFEAVILGIVQGLTEFLPISSTAHLRIVPAILHWQDPGTAFSAVIQLGTMFAVIIYFWKDLIRIYGSFFKEIIREKKLISHDSKLAFWILFGTVPICVFGFLFKDPIEAGAVRSLSLISFYLMFFGLLLFISEMFAKETRTLSNINALDIMLIGLAQSFALIPGVSRAAVTILAGLILGFKRSHAARFSFLLSVPAVLLSGALEMHTLITTIKTSSEQIIWTNLFIGTLVACVSGYLAIAFLLRYLETHKTYVFILYRFVLGILIIYLNYKGIIH